MRRRRRALLPGAGAQREKDRGAGPLSTPLSACIISFDEQDRIEACLDSVAFCDEVIVVDSHSSDRTRELSAARGARVIERDWPGHVAQKEFAIRQATHDWVLCIDCDERVTPRLRAEIEDLAARGFPGPAGWTMPRLSSFLGVWVRHGHWYPDRQLRLFDRHRAHWGGHNPHDRVAVEGSVGNLAGDLIHHPYRSLSDNLCTVDRYTTIMAAGLHEGGRRARGIDLATHFVSRFVQSYLLKGGWRLGWRGLLLASIAAHYGQLKYAKLLMLQESVEPPDDASA